MKTPAKIPGKRRRKRTRALRFALIHRGGE